MYYETYSLFSKPECMVLTVIIFAVYHLLKFFFKKIKKNNSILKKSDILIV